MREWGHQWLYDEDELTRVAVSCGFSPLTRCAPFESTCSRFRGLDYRSQSLTMEFAPAAAKAALQVGASSQQALVSILIPAFNPKFFEDALQSALAQDYGNCEIIVSDDSPGNAISAIVSRCSDARIRYQRNATPFGPAGNYIELFRLAKGDYIKYLNDDDLLEPHCVSRLAAILARFPHVSLATSSRQRIDERGIPMPNDHVTRPVVDKDCIVSGQYANSLLYQGGNFIGEPSTAMFRKQQMQGLGGGPFDVFGATILWNVDMAMWMKLLSAGDLAYLVTPLSRFRIHGEQVQKNPNYAHDLGAGLAQLKYVAARVGMNSAPKTQQVAMVIT
jgi:glycosyltransferase involved in cell wall biosynthesis